LVAGEAYRADGTEVIVFLDALGYHRDLELEAARARDWADLQLHSYTILVLAIALEGITPRQATL
jgi:hypothetical protein